MINPKAGYHRLDKIGMLNFSAGGAVGAHAQSTLEESIGGGAGTFEHRFLARKRRTALQRQSITTLEEAVGAARAVPDQLEKLIGKEAVEALRSNDLRKSLAATMPAFERFPQWEERELRFGAKIGEPPSGQHTKGLSGERSIPPGGGSEFSLVENDCMPAIRNQGDRWTCVAFATCAVVEYAFCRDRKVKVDLSEQYHYWDTKCNDPDGYSTLGTYPDISFSQAKLTGICHEPTWPYDMYNDPPQNDPQGPAGTPQAANYRVTNSIPVGNYNDVAALKRLISESNPVAITIPVYNSWSTSPAVYDSGNIGMPFPGETSRYGHAVVLVGFGDQAEFPGGGFFIIRNSYGTDWGYQCPFGRGYGTIPYEYIANDNMSAFIVRV